MILKGYTEKEITYNKPNFDAEWEEALRYPEFEKMGKDNWIKFAEFGYVTTYSKIKDVLGNVDLDFNNLEPDKKNRFNKSFDLGIIEMPIAVKFSDDNYDLVAGNTRLSGLVNKKIDPKIWVVDIKKLIYLAHSAITRKKGKDYAPDVHELQAWINDNYLSNNKNVNESKNMKNLIATKLQGIVKENHGESNNYMFFNNLKTMHDAITGLMQMDLQKVDNILSDGHGWALDHMATSADDIEEVYHFLSAQMGDEQESYAGESEGGYEDEYGNVENVNLNEAEYKGKTVKLGKPTKGDVKKFKVFVKNAKGNVVKVNFGDPNMEIKRDNPKRRKSFRARHKCSQAKDRTTPKYWSCKMWSKTPVSKIVSENDNVNEKLSIFVNKDIIKNKLKETFNQDDMELQPITEPKRRMPDQAPVRPMEAPAKPERIKDLPFKPMVSPGIKTQPKLSN